MYINEYVYKQGHIMYMHTTLIYGLNYNMKSRLQSPVYALYHNIIHLGNVSTSIKCLLINNGTERLSQICI